jgi:hypothetical protein
VIAAHQRGVRFAVLPDERRSAYESSGSHTTDRPGWRWIRRCRRSPRPLRAPARREGIAGRSPASTRRQRASRREPSRGGEVMRGKRARLLELLPREVREFGQRSGECPKLTRLHHAQTSTRRNAKARQLIGRDAPVGSDDQIVTNGLASCIHGLSLPRGRQTPRSLGQDASGGRRSPPGISDGWVLYELDGRGMVLGATRHRHRLRLELRAPTPPPVQGDRDSISATRVGCTAPGGHRGPPCGTRSAA